MELGLMKENKYLQIENKHELAIGVFDSGVGGLTIVREILKFLPRESIIYLGDTARLPYGNKSTETVLRFTKEAIYFFLAKKVKMLLIACNTSSSLALPYLKDDYDFPIYGVIEPAIEEALRVTRINKIGVIGTKATIESKIYDKEIKQKRPEVEVYSHACPLFVPLIEEGWLTEPITYKIAEKYLFRFRDYKIDTLILGCTHYPLIKDVIKYAVGEGVALIDSGETFIRMIKELIVKTNLHKRGTKKYEFYVTDEPQHFKNLSSLFLNEMVNEVIKIDLEDYKECIRFQ